MEMKITGYFFRSGYGVPKMRFYHPSHATPIVFDVEYLNKLGYDIPTKVSQAEEEITKAYVWFNVPNNKPTMSLLVGKELEIARMLEKQEDTIETVEEQK